MNGSTKIAGWVNHFLSYIGHVVEIGIADHIHHIIRVLGTGLEAGIVTGGLKAGIVIEDLEAGIATGGLEAGITTGGLEAGIVAGGLEAGIVAGGLEAEGKVTNNLVIVIMQYPVGKREMMCQKYNHFHLKSLLLRETKRKRLNPRLGCERLHCERKHLFVCVCSLCF